MCCGMSHDGPVPERSRAWTYELMLSTHSCADGCFTAGLEHKPLLLLCMEEEACVGSATQKQEPHGISNFAC